ncbi:nuclear cap-binding protein subunit 1-like [Clavelina lepadiformis]|uniref:nuclear cap-binding protein subunit 1-like n=1 Tax=Clavelina lepadiformis TaxID=159417 RepID=UPI00404141D9
MSNRRRAHQHDSDLSDDEAKASFGKRRKTSESNEEIEKRLESLICRVGEKSSSSLESNLEGLAAVLEADLPNFKPQILHILVLCSYQLPEKCSIYSTLLGLLNVRNYNCGAEFIEMVYCEMKRLIVTNQFNMARYILQFIGDLVNSSVVTPSSMMGLLGAFADVTKQEGVPQSRKDWFVYALMAALPWCGSILSEKKGNEMETLFSKLHKYVSNRNKDHHKFLRVWSSDDPHPQEDYVECLYAQICKLREDGWIEDIILRPYHAFQPVLADALQHNLPQFIPPPHIAGSTVYPLPKVIFRMFDYTDCPEGPLIPGNHAIERWLIEEHLSCLTRTYKYDKKECANRLLAIPGRDKMPLNHMIIETLLGDMFRLPSSPNPQVFYMAVFIELCKIQPSMMPQVLALASDMLYERLDMMQITCLDRFVNWFAQHLSNFQFRWSWDEWSDCLTMDPAMPKPKFIREVLEKCVRLAYHQRVCEIMPPEFQALLPSNPKIEFKYAIEAGSGSSEELNADKTTAQKIISAIKNKGKDDELIVMLDVIKPHSDGSEFNVKRLEIFLQSLLFLAQKSFSHSFSALAKFHKVIKWAADGEEGKIESLRILQDVWRNHPQKIGVLVDKMLRMQIVDCSSVAKWIFSPEMASDFTRLYTWEIMHATIRKMNKHLAKLEGEMAEMRERAAVAEKKDDCDENDDMMKGFNLFAPNEDDLRMMQEKVDAASSDQKKLFLIIFQRFIMILSDHLVRSKSLGCDYKTPWFRNTIQRLGEIFLLHKDTVVKFMMTLENLLFTSDLDPHILTIFQQFSSISR